MLQRVNEGQDGTRGHLMYGSCPGLHATQSSHLAPPHVQGGHELASCGSSACGYRFECWRRHEPDRSIAADARAAGHSVERRRQGREWWLAGRRGEFYCVREWRLSLGRPCLTRAIVVCTSSLKILLTKSPWAGKPNVCSTPPAFSFVNNCVIYIPLYTLGKYGGCHTAVSLITRVRRVRDRPTDLGPPAVRPLHHRPTDLGGGVRDLGWQLSILPAH